MDRHATRAVVGAGQWGTTLALHLARRGPVTLLARDEEQARRLSGERRNSHYLPEVTLPVEIEISADPATLASATELVVFAVPSKAMRTSAERVRGAIHQDAVLLSVAKGVNKASAKVGVEGLQIAVHAGGEKLIAQGPLHGK